MMGSSGPRGVARVRMWARLLPASSGTMLAVAALHMKSATGLAVITHTMALSVSCREREGAGRGQGGVLITARTSPGTMLMGSR